VLLVFVAAGIFTYGVHDFQEAGVLPGLDTLAFDVSGVLDPNSWYGAALAGMFNITPAPTVLESIAWVVYVVPVLVAFLWPARPRPAATPSSPGVAPGTPSNPETHENVRA
jgi:high-affinity iron transporter